MTITTTTITTTTTTTTTTKREEKIPPGAVTIDCSRCPDVRFSTCNVLLKFSAEYEAIVKTTLTTGGEGEGCSCLSGFLPLFNADGSLSLSINICIVKCVGRSDSEVC